MKKTVIVFGSSRSTGNTYEACNLVRQNIPIDDYIDLANYTILDFDYSYKNSSDDFSTLVEKVLSYQTIILATPIYWYTMSASMKRFVDRITDFLDPQHNLFGQLNKKNLAIITSYASYPEGKNGFETIFINTAKFLNMNYLGCYFHYAGNDQTGLNENPDRLLRFCEKFM